MQTSYIPSFDCAIPHATTAPGALNHVEVYVTQTHIEVWVSDVSADGASFPDLQMLWAGDIALPFSRGYVSLALRNHATMKYWLGSAASARFDNVGFDGPVVTGAREYSAPDSLDDVQGPVRLHDGRRGVPMGGRRHPRVPRGLGPGDVRADDVHLRRGGAQRRVLVPTSTETAPPAALHFSGVTKGGARRARVALAAAYPWFEWNMMFPPPTMMALRLRWNGGAWRDRSVTPVEANAFTDFNPSLGGAGAAPACSTR